MRTETHRLVPRLVTALMATFLIGTTATAEAAADKPGSPAAAEARTDIKKTLGFVPQFFLDLPESVLPGTWQEMKGLQLNPASALPGKTKELIGLAVSAQIPCKYCIIGHTEFAKLNGASKAEIGEALAMAAITRHWSTQLNGSLTDEAAFRGEIGRLVGNAKKAAAAPPAAPPRAVAVTDAQSAAADMNQTLGFTPDFLNRFAAAGRAGAWRTMKEVQMSPSTALSAKHKELIGLAVAAQVPCKYCVIAHTEFAKLAGATDAEIAESIAMASFTRHMSTLLNGAQVDESRFNRDVAQLVAGAKAAAKVEAPKGRAETARATTGN